MSKMTYSLLWLSECYLNGVISLCLWVYVYVWIMGLYGQSWTDVYFTSSGPFLMHNSQGAVKISTLNAGGTVFVFVIISDFVFTCI